MSLVGRPLKVNYAYLQIANEIEAQIMNGTLKLGERLPGEVELAEMFGVTRSTIREGLRQLESDGLVHRPSPRRLEVAIPQADMLTSRSRRSMTLMKVTFRELWQVALETEPLAAGLAAEFATADEISALKNTHTQLTQAQENEAETIELDTRFHSQIAEMGENRVLRLAREPIALLLFQGFTQVAPKVPQAVGRQIVAHGNIVDAISSRNAMQAREWARRHIGDFWRGVQLAGLEDQTPIKAPKV
jgi:GntR family transcriptional regulator, transcriptional repressor for pyruvate dehydrogenase complex